MLKLKVNDENILFACVTAQNYFLGYIFFN